MVGFVVAVVAMSGCAVKFSSRSTWDIEQIQQLSQQLEQTKLLAQLKASEADQLRQAKAELERRFGSNQGVTVGFDERGLVVRVLDSVVFDSGKATVRRDAHTVLDQIARVLNQDLKDQPIGIEGHTDNEPIKHSGWRTTGSSPWPGPGPC